MDLDNGNLFPYSPDASTLVVSCQPQDYSASVIARAVEDCDAHVINLNVLGDRTPCGALQVALRIDRRNAFPVSRSLRRFGYDIIEVEAPREADFEAEHARTRANELLRYLEI